MLTFNDKLAIACIGFFLAVPVAVFVKWCNNPDDPMYAEPEPRIDTIYNSDSIKIYQQAIKIIQESHERQLRRYSDSIFKLHKKYNGEISRLSEIKQRIQVDSFRVDFDTAAQNERYKDLGTDIEQWKAKTIPVPSVFEYKDSTIAIGGFVQKTGIDINSIVLPNTLYQREINQKYGFMNLKRRTVVQSFNTNPHISIIGGVTTTVEHRPSWWNRWGKPVLFTAAGIFIGTKVKK